MAVERQIFNCKTYSANASDNFAILAQTSLNTYIFICLYICICIFKRSSLHFVCILIHRQLYCCHYTMHVHLPCIFFSIFTTLHAVFVAFVRQLCFLACSLTNANGKFLRRNMCLRQH